jgi:uncharacterized membrane protein YeaQ/YmgE (transglycosylase-associated protein family)
VTWFIVVLCAFGFGVGALGRLAVPGPNPMSIVSTMAVGVAGSLLGGLLGLLLFDRIGGVVLSIVASALIVWYGDHRRTMT